MTYNFTPSLRGVGTINTDFAETEVDQRLINLTRFPLFFPEKRAFFLDGATFFDFYTQSAFFSRQIGLDADGQPQRIDVGSKVTGQAGRQDIGAALRADRRRGRRARRGLPGRAHAPADPAAVVHRRHLHRPGDPRPVRGRRPATPPGSTSGSRPRPSSATRTWRSSGYLLWNSDPRDVRTTAWGTTAGVPERHLGGQPRLRGGAARPQSGRRIHPADRLSASISPSSRYSPRPAGSKRIRRFRFGGEFELFTDFDNRWVTRSLDFTVGRVELHSGDNAEFGIEPSYERLEEDFEIYPGIILPAGSDYEFTRYAVEVNTANQRIVSLRPGYEWGSFLSGDRQELSLEHRLPSAPRRDDQPRERVEHRAPGRGPVHDPAAPADRRHAVQPVHVPGEQRAVRRREPPARLAVALPVDRPAGQRRLRHLHPQLDGRPARPEGLGDGRFRTLDRRGAAKIVYTKRF